MCNFWVMSLKGIVCTPLLVLFLFATRCVVGVVLRGQLWSHEKEHLFRATIEKKPGSLSDLVKHSPHYPRSLIRLLWERKRNLPCFCHWSLRGKPNHQPNKYRLHLTFVFSSPSHAPCSMIVRLQPNYIIHPTVSFWQNLQPSSNSRALFLCHPVQMSPQWGVSTYCGQSGECTLYVHSWGTSANHITGPLGFHGSPLLVKDPNLLSLYSPPTGGFCSLYRGCYIVRAQWTSAEWMNEDFLAAAYWAH